MKGMSLRANRIRSTSLDALAAVSAAHGLAAQVIRHRGAIMPRAAAMH